MTYVNDGYKDVLDYINDRPDLKAIGDKTKKFLEGFYSDFSLELLSSVHYIMQNESTYDIDLIYTKLNEWSNRKHSLFGERFYVSLAVEHIKANCKI